MDCMTREEAWRLGRRPALDGVRGIAILLVVASHLALPGMEGAGAIGVTVFFALSGFLITGLLLAEHDRTGRIHLRAFYARRARRLLPALVVTTAATVAVSGFFGPWFFEWRDLLPVLLYFGNWVEAIPGVDLGVLGGTWSLAVEEQFYMLWPLVLIWALTMGRRTVLWTAGVLAALSLAVHIQLLASGASSDRIYYASDTVAFGLLVGALLVTWLGRRPIHSGSGLVAAGALAALVWLGTWPNAEAHTVAPIFAALVTAALIFAATGRSRVHWLEARWLRWFGQRSYGIYLIHGTPAGLLRDHTSLPWPVIVVLVLPVSLLVAEASYRWIERPVMDRRWSLRLLASNDVARTGSVKRGLPSRRIVRDSVACGPVGSDVDHAGPRPWPGLRMSPLTTDPRRTVIQHQPAEHTRHHGE